MSPRQREVQRRDFLFAPALDRVERPGKDQGLDHATVDPPEIDLLAEFVEVTETPIFSKISTLFVGLSDLMVLMFEHCYSHKNIMV